MPNQHDLLFLKAAFNKGYIDQKITNYLLEYLKKCESQGKNVKLLDLLLSQARSGIKTFLSLEQIAELSSDIAATMLPDPIDNNARKNFSTDSAEITVAYSSNVSPPNSSEITVAYNEVEAEKSKKMATSLSKGNSVDEKFHTLKGMFAHYNIEKELGKGGMGVVYKAYDTRLKRTVALKVLLQNRDIAQTPLQRFIREAYALAQIDHQNVISIFDVGDLPQPYFTMEYIEGEDLASKIRKGVIKPIQAAKLLKKVANALYFVHKHGIIHRDIKPANIMIQKNDEPKLMDFGLAKTEDTNLSQSGDFLGTPAYMPPEQVNNLSIDARSDIYSLGATLYQAITGRSPFQGNTVYNIIYQICNKEPIAPRRLNPDINPDLEAICLKCMEKSPRQRYSNARMLSRDLQNFLEQRPVMAKPATTLTFVKKWLLRNKAISLISSISLLLLLVGMIAFIKKKEAAKNLAEKSANIAYEAQKQLEEKNKKIKKQMELIEQKRIEIEQKRRKIEKSLYIAKIGLAEKHTRQYNITLASKVLNECPKHLRQWEWYLLKDQAHEERQSALIELKNVGDKTTQLKSCMFTPDDNILLLADVESGNHVFKRKIVAMNTELHILWQREIANSSIPNAFSPDGKYFAYAKREEKKDVGREILVMDLASGKILFRQKHKQIVDSCAFDPQGEKLLIATVYATHYGRLSIWEWRKNKRIKTMTDEISGLDEINYCVFSSNGSKIAYCCHYKEGGFYHNKIKLWHWASDKPPQNFLARHKGTIQQCVFVPNRKMLISVSDDQRVIIWNDQNGRLRDILGGHFGDVKCCAVSPDQKTLVTAGNDKDIKVWTLKKEDTGESAELSHNLRGHSHGIQSCAFSPDGNTLITGDSSGELKTWDIHKGYKPMVMKNAIGFYCYSFDKRGERAVLTNGGSIQIGNVTMSERISTKFFRDARYSIFNSQGNKVIAGNKQGKLLLWDLKTGKEQYFQAHILTAKIRTYKKTPEINWIDIHDDLLATASEDYSLALWDMKNFAITKTPICRLIHGTSVTCCNFSKDGKILISAAGAIVRIWENSDTKTPDWKTRNILMHGNSIYACLFYKNDSMILSAASNNELRLWNFRKIRLFKLNSKHWNCIEHSKRLAYLQDQFAIHNIPLKGKIVKQDSDPFQFLIESGNRQYTVIGKNPPVCYLTGRFVKFLGHSDAVYCCAVSPDGKRFVSGGKDTTLQIWDAEKGAKLLDNIDENTECIEDLEPILTLTGHTGAIKKCIFSPNGKMLFSLSDDKTIRIWNAPGFTQKTKH